MKKISVFTIGMVGLPTAEWGTPVDIEDGARTVTNATVKVAMITATPDDENGVKDAG